MRKYIFFSVMLLSSVSVFCMKSEVIANGLADSVTDCGSSIARIQRVVQNGYEMCHLKKLGQELMFNNQKLELYHSYLDNAMEGKEDTIADFIAANKALCELIASKK